MLIISQSLPPERSEILETKNKHLNNVWVRNKITIYYKKHLELNNNENDNTKKKKKTCCKMKKKQNMPLGKQF